MDKEIICRLSLKKVPHIGDVHARALFSHFGSAEEVFKAPLSQLEKIEGIGTIRAKSIRQFKNFLPAEKELNFVLKHGIELLCFGDNGYPKRLTNCTDAPFLLFYKGNTPLNASRIISVVGTRNNTEYGKQCCEQLIADLSESNIIVVSGLAYGIDTIAHKASLHNNINTIAVLAHGLDRIYPPSNTGLAREIIDQGGLLTDFPNGTAPDKQNFPSRNRITAGLCDALIIIETGKKGGSLITADIAFSYNRDIFAFPGKATDAKSQGCNDMIKTQKAMLISNAADVLETMRWNPTTQKSKINQRSLFTTLNEEESKVFNFLMLQKESSIDDIMLGVPLSQSKLAQALLTLEMNGQIQTLPGKIYKCL